VIRIKEGLFFKMTEIKPMCYTTEVLERYNKISQPDKDLSTLFMRVKFISFNSFERNGRLAFSFHSIVIL
jgi:hypothetical protein